MIAWTERLLFFPLKSRSKEPATPHGHRDARPLSEWTIQAENWGIRCGPESGITVIDVDPRNGGRLEDVLPLLPDAPRVRTGGGGWHFYCLSVPQETRFVKIPGIDFKNNGYVVSPGSIHPSGNLYEWEQEGDLPSFPEAFIAPEMSVPISSSASVDFFPDDITDMLGAISAEDRKMWLEVGMALHSVDPEMGGFELWHNWSKTARSYKSVADCSKVWGSFKKSGITLATLVKHALDAGYRRPLVDMSGQFAPKPRPTVEEPAPISFTPTIPVFLLEEIRRWAIPACDPVSAIAVALILGSLKVARQVRTDKGDLPVLFFGLVGPSATSGICAGDAVESALREASLGWMLRGGSLSTEEKLKKALLRSAVLFHFSHAWAANVVFSNRQPSGAMGAALRVFDRIYKGSILHHEDEKKPDEEPTAIFSPHVSLLASIGHDELPKLMASEEMAKGGHEKILYVPLKKSGDSPPGDLPSTVLHWLRGDSLKNSQPPESQKPPSWTTLSIGSPEMINEDPVFSGYLAIARRIALVLTAVDDPFALSVSDAHLAWAVGFVDYCAKSVKPEESSGGDGKLTASDYVVNFIRKKGKNGCQERDLVQSVKPYRNTKKKDRSEMIELLIEDGFIVRITPPGKRAERLYHSDFIKKEESI